ncbi:trigger factor, partial [Campylobacter jejuni]
MIESKFYFIRKKTMEVKAKQLDSVNATASVKIPSGMIKSEVENLAKK